MLKNLSPLHTPKLLHTLASMGHGDDIVVVDAHFPAVSMAKRLIRLDGVYPNEIPEVQQEFQKIIDQEEGKPVPLVKVERHAFYERARQSFAIIATGELRTYGCVIIKKGVILPK